MSRSIWIGSIGDGKINLTLTIRQSFGWYRCSGFFHTIAKTNATRNARSPKGANIESLSVRVAKEIKIPSRIRATKVKNPKGVLTALRIELQSFDTLSSDIG
jgi:hypothetical protein